MATFMPRVSPAVATPDPSKHVNYTLGMLLGADDFTQEFAYLSGRDQWLARDLLGYGTVNGLKVSVGANDKGPRVLVEPGVALSPRGQLIRVAPAQCAYLNQWLASNHDALGAHISNDLFSSPGKGVRLYVVLCYRDCATDMAPIPGEPCRTEDELMAASRLVDDFRLELRFEPPYQEEEDALRDFVDWLAQVEITDASTTTLEDFLNAIRRAAPLLAATHASPPSPLPSSPPMDYMFGSPPEALNIPSRRAREYFRAAFRVWVTELRPLWRPNWFGEWQCCTERASKDEGPAREECLLLAELDVPLVNVAITGEVKVDDARETIVNEERRPFLIHLRMLQEWLLNGRAAAGVASLDISPHMFPLSTIRRRVAAPGEETSGGIAADVDLATMRQSVVAAGSFSADGSSIFSFGGLRVLRNSSDPTLYLLTGPWFTSSDGEYIVKGTPIGDLNSTSGQTFETIVTVRVGRLDIRLATVMQGFGRGATNGVIVRVRGVATGATGRGFTVEISKYLTPDGGIRPV